MELKEIKYSIPIKEFGTEDSEFKIKGVAINETTTSNGHRFLAEELRDSSTTLNGVPLLKDHNNSVDSIVGRVKTSIFDEVNKNIRFEAVIMDSKVREMVKDGRLNSVSVGASVKDLEEADDGALIARGIKFHELSVVAVPADAGATFNVALMEAYNSEKSENDTQLKGGQENTMSEEAEKTTETEVEATETEPEAPEAPAAPIEPEAPVAEEKLDAVLKELADLKKQLSEKKAEVKEADDDEADAEPEADDEEEVEENYKLVTENGFGSTSFTVVRKNYNGNNK